MRLVPLALVMLLGLGACSCLEEISLRPELKAGDLAQARAGTGSVEVVWKFKDCCPTSDQEEIALRLQSNVADLWDQLVEGRIELQRYNELVRAAHDAITQVILVCSRSEPLGASAAIDTVWRDCGHVADRIRSAVR